MTPSKPSTPDPDDRPASADDYPVSWAIFALARSHRTTAAGLLAGLGLFPGQEIMLMQLWDRDGQSQKQLGHTLRVDHSTVAKSVQRLEGAGLVTRARSSDDGRVTLVFLTRAGRALKKRTLAAWAALEQRTVRGLSPAEQAQFVKLARRIAPNVD